MLLVPIIGNLPDDGFSEYSPPQLAGTLMLPPMSVPTPTGAPRSAPSTPSPVDDPPGERTLLNGLRVCPQRRFSPSIIIIPVGTLVLTWPGIAPRSRRSVTSMDSGGAGDCAVAHAVRPREVE